MKALNVFILINLDQERLLFIKDKKPRNQKLSKRGKFVGEHIMCLAYTEEDCRNEESDKNHHIERLSRRFACEFSENSMILAAQRVTPLLDIENSCYWCVEIEDKIYDYLCMRTDVVPMKISQFLRGEVEIRDYNMIKTSIDSIILKELGKSKLRSMIKTTEEKEA